jgi:hypothetical protein
MRKKRTMSCLRPYAMAKKVELYPRASGGGLPSLLPPTGREQKLLDAVICIVEPPIKDINDAAYQLHAGPRLAFHQVLKISTLNTVKTGIPYGSTGGKAVSIMEKGHFTDKIAATDDGQGSLLTFADHPCQFHFAVGNNVEGFCGAVLHKQGTPLGDTLLAYDSRDDPKLIGAHVTEQRSILEIL